jgi:hypothetical protein
MRASCSSLLSMLVAVGAVTTSSACETEGCLDGAEGCVVSSPCAQLEAPTCDAGFARVHVVGPEDRVPGGLAALGAVGDVMLSNDRVTAVIESIDNPNVMGATGGFLIDLSTRGDDNDTLNHVFPAASPLPDDAVAYERMELLSGDGFAAVQVIGHLVGDPDHRVATRYEVRPCEPGVRVRTEMFNGAEDDVVWVLGDAFLWGGRKNMPFAPTPGAGFVHPAISLTALGDALRTTPFFVGSAWSRPAASYALVSCSDEQLHAFHSADLSGAGGEPTIVRPGDFVTFDRVLLAASGRAVQPAADLALAARARLWGEPYAAISGRLSAPPSATLGPDSDRAFVVISEGEPGVPYALRTPWSVVLPDRDGAFRARVPANGRYVVDVIAFGDAVASVAVDVGADDVSVGAIAVPAAGSLRLSATIDDRVSDVLVFLRPADDETEARTRQRWLGASPHACAPLLGYPYGPSPACDRVLVAEPVLVDVPPGAWDLFATGGPYRTIGRARVDVNPGEQLDLSFTLRSVDVLPAGVLSGDFHVHGPGSFDSSLPAVDRVRSLLAAGLDVVAATEHDNVGDWSAELAALGKDDADIVLLPGTEATPAVLWGFNPDVDIPEVIGHWNFWPLRQRPDRPRDGAPTDERGEPAQIFTRMKQAELPSWGVIQLNHPIGGGGLGRDIGWATALRLDLDEDLPLVDDGSGAALFHRQPPGSEYRNSDFHTQEAMNGLHLLEHRAFWFYVLSQGFLRTGVANSDAHTLTDGLVGTPRTLVFTQTSKADFDAERFHTDLRAGRAVGTTGPVIEARLTSLAGGDRRPALSVIAPRQSESLFVRVRAAPWVPVEQIRVIVNGEVAHVIDDGITNPETPFADGPLLRFEGAVPLEGLLPPVGDAWLVVEAGRPLPPLADLDCDGVPDTTDNNADGVADWRDVDADRNGVVDQRDLDRDGDGVVDGQQPACVGPTGPLDQPGPWPRRDAPGYPFRVVTNGNFPHAFTNPFVFDLDGDGVFSAPGRR